jgi:DNA-binding GntR family transcriptional regulator
MPTDFPLLTVDQGSRGDRVAAALREVITSGQYEPGDRLVEGDLARQLGTSRGPIRDALRMLEREGLVVSYPYRGTVVADVSQQEIERVLLPIRIIVERFAYRRALPRVSDTDLELLEELVSAMRLAGERGDAQALADADLRFHEHLIALSGQSHCLQLWRTVQPRVRAYFRHDAHDHKDAHEVARQHQLLLDVLRTGDPEALDEAIREHINTRADEPNR